VKALILLLTMVVSNAAFAVDGKNAVDSMIDVEHSRTWNRFAERVVALHRQQIAGRKVRVEERVGNYGGEMAKRYRFHEASYYDDGSGRLLSRVRSDRDRPEDVQIAEVYVHDNNGRVQRDYAFIYLPWGRGAPVRTFVSLHDYRDGLHVYRQFDASGKPIHERCEGTFDGRRVEISLPEERVGEAGNDADTYRHCFSGLPQTADAYLAPH